MPAQPPFAVSQDYDTQLDPLREMMFRQWTQNNRIPFDTNAGGPTDYDMRGYWQDAQNGNPMARQSQINPNDNRPHFTDYYKTPLHQSFSGESQWAQPGAGRWINDHQLASPGGRILFDERAEQNPVAAALARYR